MKTKKLKETKAMLRQKAKALKAQLIHNYHFASADVERASTDRMMGSGVILELTALGGKSIVAPVCIKDGLSKETIEAIQKDLARSYDLATTFKPAGIREDVKK